MLGAVKCFFFAESAKTLRPVPNRGHFFSDQLNKTTKTDTSSLANATLLNQPEIFRNPFRNA